MKQSDPLVTCTKCKGTGEIHLSRPVLKTLQVIQRSEGITTPDIFKALNRPKSHPTLVNRHLKRLKEAKLIRQGASANQRWPKYWAVNGE
jgi:Fe2+ or Zn2+ uptake regulation protein